MSRPTFWKHGDCCTVSFSGNTFLRIRGNSFFEKFRGNPFFLQKEGEVYKKGAGAPPSLEKGGSRQFFEAPAIFVIPKSTTEFSVGIGWYDTTKYQPIPTEIPTQV